MLNPKETVEPSALADSRSQRRTGHSAAQRGAGKLTAAVFLLIVGSISFVGYHVLPIYYYYFELRNQFREAVRTAGMFSDKELRRKLLSQIHWMKMPVEDEELTINRTEDTLEVRLQYTEYFSVRIQGKDYDLWEFKFDVHEKGEIR